MKTPLRTRTPLVVAGLACLLSLAACANGAAPSSPSGPSASPAPAASSDDPNAGGGSSDPGAGVGGPVEPVPANPTPGQPALVIPRPGRLNPRPIPAANLEATVDGRRVLVKATWWSGVEPCNVLDSVKVERSGTDIGITLIEGASDLTVACIEIAMQKSTIVDLGELEPGTYSISSPGGEAPQVTVTVA